MPPPPPRKPPDGTLWGLPRRRAEAVRHAGSRGPGERVTEHTHKRLPCPDPLGRGPLISTGFLSPPYGRWACVLLLPAPTVSSPCVLSQPRPAEPVTTTTGELPGPARPAACLSPGTLRAQRGSPAQGKAQVRRGWRSPHSSLHVSGLLFGFSFFCLFVFLNYLLWVGVEGGGEGSGEDK